MSVAVEASKTTLEIYQPLIVGLGAVVLGFVANSLLEIVRSALERRRSRQTLRKALIYEIRLVDRLASTAIMTLDRIELKKNEMPIGKLAFRSSRYIHDIDREKIGNLTFDEVKAVSEVALGVEGLELIFELMDNNVSNRNMSSLNVDMQFASEVRQILSNLHEACVDAEARIGAKIAPD